MSSNPNRLLFSGYLNYLRFLYNSSLCGAPNYKLKNMYGIRCTVYGVRCMVYGVRCTVYGVRCTVHGVRYTVYGVRCMFVSCTTCTILVILSSLLPPSAL